MKGKSLIIAEKPSLARNIINAIGSKSFKNNDGFYESPEYIVSWAFGHLLGLKDIEEYRADYDPDVKAVWVLDNLPFFPEQFEFRIKKDSYTGKTDSGIRRQLGCLKKLAHRSDVTQIINCGDADREGEVIIRNILIQIGNKKPVKRLWLPEQTPETIRQSLNSLEDDAKYDNLFNEGLARTYIDWLYGVNLTRLATLKSGRLLRVGRVIVPIVQAIYARDLEIESFVPETYYEITSNEAAGGVPVELTSRTKYPADKLSDADATCALYNSASPAIVTDVQTKRKTVSPGKLYSLSKLQGVLGKKYKMKPKESLLRIQKLYENGYITYPRTNSEYLAAAEAGRVNQIISLFKKQGYEVESKPADYFIYNDARIESHSALTPTTRIPSMEDLSDKDRIIYETIMHRFLAVFAAEPCEADQTTMTIQLGDYETFTLKGDVVITKGWRAFEDIETKDKELPPLKIGDEVNVYFVPARKQTSPPKHYTVETLSNYLKNPFKNEDEFEAAIQGLELGTEATRTGIIENAIASDYISLDNNTYTIQPAGRFLIESLDKLGIDMTAARTARLGKALKSIYRGEITIDDGVALAEKEIRENFRAAAGIHLERMTAAAGASTHGTDGIIGTCPSCGNDVKATAKGFFCTNGDCSFALWPTMKFYNNTLKITEARAKSLLAGKSVLFKLKKKDGKPYEAYLKIVLNGKYVNFEIDKFKKNK